MKYLNVGCGYRFHLAWENVDFQPTAPSVRVCNLRKGIPYPEATFDVVYHSHVLEHFPKSMALGFLRDCHRVLKEGGVIRVVVPDLERIARLYLETLEKASRGDSGWPENYDWMVLEMYDQSVRESSGGSAIEFLGRGVIPNWDFVYQRWGTEAKSALEFVNSNRQQNGRGSAPLGSKLRCILRNPLKFFKDRLSSAVLSTEDYQALQVGRFRRQGEVHQWMYDAYSLARLLREAGFRSPERRKAAESSIPKWVDFHLDTDADGSPYKPDSLYMEASKP